MENKTTQTPAQSGIRITQDVEKELEKLARNAYDLIEYLRTSGEITERTDKLIAELEKAAAALKDTRNKYFNSFDYLELCTNIIELIAAIKRNRLIRLSFESPSQM